MTQAAAAEAPAPAAGTAPGKITETARPEPHQPHIAPQTAPKPTLTTAAPATAPKPRKKAAKKKAAPKASPKLATASEEKLQRTPITTLRSMVRAKKLASGTDIIRLTKDKAIALLLGKGTKSEPTSDKAEVLQGVRTGQMGLMTNAVVPHGQLTLDGPAFEVQRAIEVLRANGIRLSYSMRGELY